jgi:hypothetical protein
MTMFAAALTALLVTAAPVSTTFNGMSFCCGVGNAAACSDPDWTAISFVFNANASAVAGDCSGCFFPHCTIVVTIHARLFFRTS